MSFLTNEPHAVGVGQETLRTLRTVPAPVRVLKAAFVNERTGNASGLMQRRVP